MQRDVAVIGAGNMGHGFAVHFGAHGHGVTLIDHRQSNLDWATERIDEAAGFLASEGLIDLAPAALHDRITLTLDETTGVEDADIVLETVPEDLETKHRVFDAAAQAAPADAVLASNTSGIPITDIAADRDYADRVVGCHWWFPPYLLRPVEVVQGERTSESTIERLTAFLKGVDRDPIHVEKDIPGFVWNRVQNAVIRECAYLAEQGVASIDDINRAIRDGYATRTAAIGPFETIDIAGLDLFQTVASDLFPHLCNDEKPSRLFDEYLDADRGGIDDGAGFFEYDTPPEGVTRRRDERVAAIRRALDQ